MFVLLIVMRKLLKICTFHLTTILEVQMSSAVRERLQVESTVPQHPKSGSHL